MIHGYYIWINILINTFSICYHPLIYSWDLHIIAYFNVWEERDRESERESELRKEHMCRMRAQAQWAQSRKGGGRDLYIEREKEAGTVG